MAVDEISYSSVPVTMPDQAVEQAQRPPEESPPPEAAPSEPVVDESVGQNVDVTA
jgi:hypothetical protein